MIEVEGNQHTRAIHSVSFKVWINGLYEPGGEQRFGEIVGIGSARQPRWEWIPPLLGAEHAGDLMNCCSRWYGKRHHRHRRNECYRDSSPHGPSLLLAPGPCLSPPVLDANRDPVTVSLGASGTDGAATGGRWQCPRRAVAEPLSGSALVPRRRHLSVPIALDPRLSLDRQHGQPLITPDPG